MSTITEIRIAELYAGSESDVIVTNGVGSCIVIVLYDRLSRIGGMAHAILPRLKSPLLINLPRDVQGKRFVKYADLAVDTLIEEVIAIGGKKEHISRSSSAEHTCSLCLKETNLVSDGRTPTALERDSQGTILPLKPKW